MRPIAALAVAAMVVLAGCAGQAFTGTDEPAPSATEPTTVATTTPTTTATTADSTTTTTAENASSWDTDAIPDGDDSPVNDTTTFRNLTALVDVEATKPTMNAVSGPREPGRVRTPEVLLGLDEIEGPGLNDTYGYAVSGDEIYVAFNAASDRAAERVLVHEQFHAIQFQQDWIDRYGGRETTDGILVRDGIVEGTAVWVTDQYVERHHGPDAPSAYDRFESILENGPDAYRLYNAPYLFGARWTEHHLDDPANVSRVFEDENWRAENLPRTSEQLMHNLTPSEEPVRPVGVAVEADDWYDREADQMGELYVWATLRGELGANRSRTAAAGWGGDAFRLVVDGTGEVGSFAWALRWDTERDADEFEAAARDWAAARDGNASYRVVRVNATTTLLLGGDAAFVENATVTVDDGVVVVDHGTANASVGASRRT